MNLLLVLSTMLVFSSAAEKNGLTCGTDHCDCIVDEESSNFEEYDNLFYDSKFQCPFENRNFVHDDLFNDEPLKIRISNLRLSCCRFLRGNSTTAYLSRNMKIAFFHSLRIDSKGANQDIEIEAKQFEGLDGDELFELLGMKNEIKKLPVDLFKYMKSWKRVRISVPNIHLPDNLFLPLRHLTELDLSGNNFQLLKPGLLQNLRKLAVLNLSKNALHSLGTTLFMSLTSLYELNLNSNELETLKSNVFQNMTSITEIDLSSNKISVLPDGLFTNNKKLRKFTLLKNRATYKTLPNDLLANLTHLHTVEITCGLRRIPEGIFAESSEIRYISLKNNALDELPKDLLKNQIYLETLNLSGNAITQLDDDFFLGPNRLNVLKLSKNRLREITAKLLQPLGNLQKIYLDKNQLSDIDSTAFNSFYNVKRIHMKHNFITNIDFIVQPIPISSETSRSYKYKLPLLKFLDLSHNKITKLSSRDLPARAAINLSFNQISTFDFVFEPNTYFYVYLDRNPFTCNCHIFHLVDFLTNQTEWINRISIEVGEMTCKEPPKLKGYRVRDLSVDDLSCSPDEEGICPEGCKCRENSDDQSLLIECGSKAKLDQLRVAFEIGFNYTELKIKDANLTTLPNRQSRGYNNVTRLLVSGNNISEVNKMNIPPLIRTLELNNNKLKTLHESAINFLGQSTTLQELKLANNPWNCSCENLELILFFQKSAHLISDYGKLKCADGHSVIELKIADICPSGNTFIIVISCIAALMGIAIAVFFAIYYKFEKQIKMWLYSHNICLWFVSEGELDKDKQYDAFICYSHKDGKIVEGDLVPKLESLKYKLCVHERDWLPGVEISTQISNSVNDAKRTIIVMSTNFLESNWAQWEFRVAQSHAAIEKRSRIIVILLDDIGDIHKLEPEIRDYLKLNTYVNWRDKWFWEKLQYAMPHRKTNEILHNAESSDTIAIGNFVSAKTA